MTPTQARYIAFIHHFIEKHGIAPAESEIAIAMCVAPPSVNQMIRNLERLGFISRTPGKARSIRIILPEDEIPTWKRGGVVEIKKPAGEPVSNPVSQTEPTVQLLVLHTYILTGPVSEKNTNKQFSRSIEIREDQTLAELHQALFDAFDRVEQRSYEFNIGGKRRFDPEGKNYGVPEASAERAKFLGQKKSSYHGDTRTTKVKDINLSLHQTFGYCFDFEADWYHFISVEKFDTAIRTVTYPRVTRRKGKSPPQFDDSLKT